MSHLTWIASGYAIGVLFDIPNQMVEIAKETETIGQKIKQNLELLDKYQNNHHALNDDLKHLTEVAQVYAVGYGVSVKEVLESMQIISRRFKDTNTINYITSLALTISKLDFVPATKAASDLEAVILQFGLDADGTREFVNQFTYAVHSARITGIELLDSLQRSGSSFKNFNMGTKEAISLISTLTTVTARSGSVVGNTFKSILANMDYKKAADMLKQVGIQIYDTEADGAQRMRSGEAILSEIFTKYKDLDDKGRNVLANAVSGGKFQINQVKSLLGEGASVYEEISKGIAKSSDELTSKLLKTGLQTYANNLEQLKASYESLAISLGNSSIPTLKEFTILLTAGIMYLNENKESVSKLASAIVSITTAMVAWNLIGRRLAGSLLEVALGINSIYTKEGRYVSAMNTMGSATWGFAKTAIAAISAVLAKWALVYATMEVAQAAYEQLSDSTGTYKNLASAKEELANADYSQNTLTANRGRMSDSQYQQALIQSEDYKSELQRKVSYYETKASELKENKENETSNKWLDKAEKMSREMQKLSNLGNTAGSNGSGGLDPTDPGKGSGGSAPGDKGQKVIRDALGIQQRQIFADAKESADRYAIALDNINTRTSLYGDTVGNLNAKYLIQQNRVSELAKEAKSYREKEIELTEKTIDSFGESQDKLEAMGVSQAKWKALSRSAKADIILQNRETLEQYKTELKQLELAIGYRNKANDTLKEESKLKAEIIKQKLGNVYSAENIYNRGISETGSKYSLSKISAENKFKYSPQYQVEMEKIELAQSLELQEQYLERLNQLADNEVEYKRSGDEAKLESTRESLKQISLLYSQNNQKIINLENAKNDRINSGLASITSSIITQGSTLKSIWNNLWTGLADDAIKALFRVQNATPGLLSQVLGMFSGGRPAGIQGPLKVDGSFAEGGRVNKAMVANVGEGDKPEWIIPMSDKKRGTDLWTKAGKELGVTPFLSNPNVAQQFSTGGTGLSENAQLAKLDKQNELMLLQNQMLATMANNSGNNSGVTVVPVQMSQEQLFDMLGKNPQALQGILRKAGSLRS